MRVQHLQQQVVQRDFVLALHAVQVLHSLVASGRTERRKNTSETENRTGNARARRRGALRCILPHVSDVREQEQELGLTPRLELHRDSRLADVVYEGIRDVIHHALHHEAVPRGLDGGRAEREGA